MSDELRYLAQRALNNAEADVAAPWDAFRVGTWTIIDRFDADGRRYIVARRAAGDASVGPEDVSLLERRARGEALKVIAIDLGVSVSAVSRRLSAVMKKLGIRSHAELPRLFAAA